ncbi:NAD(P)-binding protein [Ascodesmis nigricans]|uniref:NAD(P)-binding protein n=1 Tax=Ascodesmis nigricans TaxID=341454 RepID=A0A4S2N7W3_9PEZI|nr:NAD(P)-binding protein [Ascodesmis nigricans]
MTDKTVLVTGATGLLGRQTLAAFSSENWNPIGTGFSRANPEKKIHKLDLSDHDAVTALLDEVKPKALIHCAAERRPDVSASNPAATQALNIAATSHLAAVCNARKIFLLYISTDYVFSGVEGEAPYEVDSQTAPPNFYGETKLKGEEAVREEIERGLRGVVLRVPVLYGETESGNKESAVNVLLDLVWNKEGKEKVEMDHWSIRYPTNTEDVARVIKDVTTLYTNTPESEFSKLPTTLQFSAEERMTKYEICQTLGEIAGLPTDHIIPNDQDDPNAAVKRPKDCHLSTKALKEIGISVQTVPFKIWWQRYMRAFKH